MAQGPTRHDGAGDDPAAAGEFGEWLECTLAAFAGAAGASVPCGDCRACCTAGYFIPVRAQEWTALAAIPARLLVHPPGGTDGTRLIVRSRGGACALLARDACSIYAARPQACRDFDCRLFAAAGVDSGQPAVDTRIRRWRFHYASAASRAAHEAIRRAAGFLVLHADAFPGGRVPKAAADIAVAAVKAHRVFMATDGECGAPAELARRVVDSCRAFDRTGRLHP